MYRSRHIYILASGLVNLMLGLYLPRTPRGWRGTVRTVGSVLLLISSVLLILAFVSEPAKGFQSEMVCSVAGLYALFGGCMAHLVSGAANPGGQSWLQPSFRRLSPLPRDPTPAFAVNLV
jgi:hypothetical protein